MKKIVFLFLMFFALNAMAQEFPHPALCHQVTGEPIPAFFSIAYNFEGYEAGDWIGVYDDNGLCYGAMSFAAGYDRGQCNGYGNDPDTEKKDGFTNGDVMHLFLYDISYNKFYNLSGFYLHGMSGAKSVLTYHPMDLYKIDNVVKGNEIQLAVDPELSEVVFKFIALEMPIITGGSDAVKLKFIKKNTTEPMFTTGIGKGIVEKRWDGYYYKYSADDATVIINAVGKNNFTGAMVVSKLTLTFDQSVSANAIFEDENIAFFMKSGTLWVKAKTGKVIVTLYWTANGVEKKLWNGSVTGEKKLISDFARWKGSPARVQYYPYINGKMVNKNPIEKTFTF